MRRVDAVVSFTSTHRERAKETRISRKFPKSSTDRPRTHKTIGQSTQKIPEHRTHTLRYEPLGSRSCSQDPATFPGLRSRRTSAAQALTLVVASAHSQTARLDLGDGQRTFAVECQSTRDIRRGVGRGQGRLVEGSGLAERQAGRAGCGSAPKGRPPAQGRGWSCSCAAGGRPLSSVRRSRGRGA